MEPFHERLIEEEKQLTEKVKNLQAFLETRAESVDSIQIALMKEQLRVMQAYLGFLKARLILLAKWES